MDLNKRVLELESGIRILKKYMEGEVELSKEAIIEILELLLEPPIERPAHGPSLGTPKSVLGAAINGLLECDTLVPNLSIEVRALRIAAHFQDFAAQKVMVGDPNDYQARLNFFNRLFGIK